MFYRLKKMVDFNSCAMNETPGWSFYEAHITNN